jgi:ferritin-like metal-binding protein YciE
MRKTNGSTATKSTKTTSNSKTSTRSTPAKSSKSAKSSSGNSSEDLEKVLKEGLKDVYYAEKQLVKALKKMSKAASNTDLQESFDMHRAETEEQVGKVEQVFEILGMRAAGKKCPAMDGLIEEGAEAIEEYEKGPARDAALIMAAQKVEHYEMAAYGSLRTFAEVLGYDDCARILDEICEQEGDTDKKLTEVAKIVNEEAMAVGEEETEEA